MVTFVVDMPSLLKEIRTLFLCEHGKDLVSWWFLRGIDLGLAFCRCGADLSSGIGSARLKICKAQLLPVIPPCRHACQNQKEGIVLYSRCSCHLGTENAPAGIALGLPSISDHGGSCRCCSKTLFLEWEARTVILVACFFYPGVLRATFLYVVAMKMCVFH